jgi:hypothetical protein
MNKALSGAIFMAILTLTNTFPRSATAQEGTTVHKTAQSYITQFRGAEEFHDHDSVAGIVASIRLNESTLSILTEELRVGSSAVRESLVRLLEKIGLELDTPAAEKFPLVRDHNIIHALLVEGFAKDHAASTAAATVLNTSCAPSDLAVFGEIYGGSLKQLNGPYLRIATKAKTLQVRPFVEKMPRLPI